MGKSSISMAIFGQTLSGWWLTYPSEKYESVGKDDIPYMKWKINSCSKPPTSCALMLLDADYRNLLWNPYPPTHRFWMAAREPCHLKGCLKMGHTKKNPMVYQ